MNPILLSGALIFSCLLTLLSIGLTLTYLTTKVSNFAHGAVASVGAYITLTVVDVWKGNPYHYLFLALLVGGLLGLIQYFLVFRPLIRRRASNVVLMIATLAIELVLLSVLNIYADYLTKAYKIRSRYFFLASSDITVGGQRGLLVVAPSLTAIIATALHLLLTRTKFGIAMRAAIEDPSLASVVGINVDFVYAVSWIIAGGLGGISGALLPLYTPGYPEMSAIIIVSIFAASIVGGLVSIYGAVLGGLLMGFSEILGTSYLASLLGSWVIPYRPLIPTIAIVITLLLAPNGIMGVNWANVRSLRRRITINALKQKDRE